MGATGAARKLASAAALGGGGLSVLGAGLYGVLVAEAPRQIHADGIGAEQSPSYTALTLEWYLLCAAVADRAGVPLPGAATGRVALAAEALRWFIDGSGNPPRIGDDDDSPAARVPDLGGQGVEAAAAAGDHRDGGAEGGESACGGGADPAARSGDERGGPGQ